MRASFLGGFTAPRVLESAKIGKNEVPSFFFHDVLVSLLGNIPTCYGIPLIKVIPFLGVIPNNGGNRPSSYQVGLTIRLLLICSINFTF